MVAGGFLASVAVIAGLVHTPPVRSTVLSWALARLPVLGVRADVERLDYNLFTLTAGLSGVTLFAEGSDTPFFSTDAIRLDLPWSVVGGTVDIQSLEIARPRIAIVRESDGSLNLPEIADTGDTDAKPIAPLRIDRLVVRELDVRYADTSVPLSVDGRGVTLDLAVVPGGRLAGRVAMSEGVALNVGDRDTRMTTLDGGVAFDGTTLFIDALTAEAPEAHVRLDGSMSLLATNQHLDLRYDARLDAERVAPWIGLDPIPQGAVALSGTLRGPLGAPDVTLEATSDQLAWSTLGDLTLEVRAEISGPVAEVEFFRATLAGGEVSGDGLFQLDDAGASRVNARLTNLDIGTLASVAPDLPVRLAAVADGDVGLEWTGQDVTTAIGSVSTRLRASASETSALGLTGQFDLELKRDTWTLSLDQRIAESVILRGDAEGRRARSDIAASTLQGRAALDIASLPDALRRLSDAGLDLDMHMAERLRGTLSARVDLGGTFDAPRASGTLEASELWLDGTGPGTARARIDATDLAVMLDPWRLDVGPNAMSGSLTLGIRDNTLSGNVTGALPQLASLAQGLRPAWRPDGSAQFDARLGGALDDPTVQLTLSAQDLRVAGQTFRGVRTSAQVADGVVTVEHLELVQDAGQLTATGHFDIASGRYAFDAVGDDVSVLPLFATPGADTTGDSVAPDTIPLDARFDLRVSGEGTIESPQAAGVAQFSRLSWGGYALGAARADVVLENGNVRLGATVPSINATLQASVGVEAPRAFTAEAFALGADLSALVRPTGPAGTTPAGGQALFEPADVSGALTLRARASGELDDLEGVTSEIELSLLDVAIAGAPLRLPRPARLRYAGRTLGADDFELHIGNSTLSATGALGATSGVGEGLLLALTGSLADLMPIVHLAPAARTFDASGAIDLRMRASGSFDAPVIDGEFSLDSASFTAGALPPATNVALRGTYADGLLALDNAEGSWEGATVAASGRIPASLFDDVLPVRYLQSLPQQDGPARVTARVLSLNQDMLSSFVAPETIAGLAARFDATIEAEADSFDLDDVRATVTLDRALMALARVPLIQRSPTRLQFARGRLDILDWSWAGAGSRLDLVGGVALSGETPQFGLAVTGALNLGMLGAFVPEIATAGLGSLDIRISGPADDPVVEGQMAVTGGDVVVREPRFAITDLEGLVTLIGDRILLRNVTASANGGTFDATGEVAYQDLAVTEATITMTGRGLAFEVPENLLTEVNTDLVFRVSQMVPSLTGRVTILQGSYREPVSLAGQLLAGTSVATIATETSEPSFADRIQLAVAITSDQDIVVDNNYGRLDLGSNLRVIGTVGEPLLAGRLTVQEGGEIFLGGRNYLVRRGTVDFTNATQVEPDMNLVLETRVQRYDITLDVIGTPQTLQASLRSPGVSQEDVISLLLTGQLSGGAAMAQTEIARGQLLMLLSGELLGFAGRAVGVDSLQVGRGLGGAASDFDLLGNDTDPSARLTVAKDLRRDVEVVFSQSLRERGDITWIAMYRPLRDIEFRGTTADDNSRAYEFRHELSFGRGVSPPVAAGATPLGGEAQVTAVTFTGTPGLGEDHLRRAITLDAGDRFDFYRWQQDQDRLVALYHAHDFLEARVQARRQADGADRVALVYEILRGPRTTLAIVGDPLPGGLIEDMKREWSESVFDGFLLDDVQTMARRALAGQGRLQAEVTAAVTSPPESDVKEITVQVTQGPLFETRRRAFSGNTRISAEALEAIVRTRGPGVTAWLNPAELELAIEQYYRSIGSLAADVTVDTPIFAGRAATLPVRIDEGPQFRVAHVQVVGPTKESQADVRDTFGITTGALYEPSAVEPARREVELTYLQRGYNDVRVSVTTLVDTERAEVDMSLTVAEGRQQILTGVDVSGADVTARATIDRALNLETGQPANLTDYYRAQKRLYDTGVFQSADVTIDPVADTSADESDVQPVRASVSLVELPRYRFRYGVRLSDTVGPTEAGREVRPALVVDLLRRNLLGRAVSTGVAGQLEADRRLARGFVSLPQMFGAPVTTNLFLTTSREDFNPNGSAFVEDKAEVTAEQRFRPATNMGVSYGYSFARTHVFQLEQTPGLPRLDLSLKIARLTGTYAWDTRDDPSNARRGWFHSSGLEYAPEKAGSDIRFVRYLAQQYYFRTFSDAVVLASAFRLGAARGIGQELIPSEKFFAGGGTSVRGFAEEGLGEPDFFGDPTGGNALVLFNQEVRFPVYKWLRGVGFLDAGNTFPNARDISFTNLEAGVGFGLRIHSPFALLRIDYGVPITSRQREPSGRWYFAIGQTF
jgi:outer membrane protein assembly complex protein YaeT